MSVASSYMYGNIKEYVKQAGHQQESDTTSGDWEKQAEYKKLGKAKVSASQGTYTASTPPTPPNKILLSFTCQREIAFLY